MLEHSSFLTVLKHLFTYYNPLYVLNVSIAWLLIYMGSQFYSSRGEPGWGLGMQDEHYWTWRTSTAHKPYATATSYHNNWPSRIPRLLSLRPHQICFFCRSRLLKDRHLTCISGYIRYDSHGNFTIWVAIIDIISRTKKGIVSCIYMHVVLSVQDLFYSSDLVLYCNI